MTWFMASRLSLAPKGWPSFNEFGMQTMLQVTRKLQFVRDTNSTAWPLPVARTNQMYLLGISNVLGVEGWNSYTSAFPRSLELMAVVDQFGTVSNESVVVTGPDGSLLSHVYSFSMISNFPSQAWPAFSNNAVDGSFTIPLFTNYWFLSNCQYQFGTGPEMARFVSLSGIFESSSPSKFSVPHWWLSLRTRLRFILVDTSVNRIVDYVNLDSTENPLDIIGLIMQGGYCGTVYTPNGSDGAEWCTNRVDGSNSEHVPTSGIVNQIGVCQGWITPTSWYNYLISAPFGGDINRSIRFFDFQFGLGASDGTYGISNVFYAPFSPYRNIYYSVGWSANDPTVHYTLGDLLDPQITNRLNVDAVPTAVDSITNLGRMNRRYEPWGGGGNPVGSSSKTKYDLTVKDPLVTRSDDWNFPTNQGLDLTSFGRVHRGTPWQTIYLKAPAASSSTWLNWVGTNVTAAQQMHPTNDWQMVSLLLPLLNTNDPRNLLSVNEPNVAAWCGALDGITALTNISTSTLNALLMTANSAQATNIATALVTNRASRPGRFYRGIGGNPRHHRVEHLLSLAEFGFD